MTNTKQLIQSTLKYLGLRPRTTYEVTTLLKKHQATLEQSNEILKYLTDSHLVNDQEFISWYSASRSRSKPRSKKLIALELRRFGIHIPADQLSVDEDSTAYNLAKKLLPRIKSLPARIQKQKLYSHLAQKGYPSSIIDRTLKKLYNPDIC